MEAEEKRKRLRSKAVRANREFDDVDDVGTDGKLVLLMDWDKKLDF